MGIWLAFTLVLWLIIFLYLYEPGDDVSEEFSKAGFLALFAPIWLPFWLCWLPFKFFNLIFKGTSTLGTNQTAKEFYEKAKEEYEKEYEISKAFYFYGANNAPVLVYDMSGVSLESLNAEKRRIRGIFEEGVYFGQTGNVGYFEKGRSTSWDSAKQESILELIKDSPFWSNLKRLPVSNVKWYPSHPRVRDEWDMDRLEGEGGITKRNVREKLLKAARIGSLQDLKNCIEFIQNYNTERSSSKLEPDFTLHLDYIVETTGKTALHLASYKGHLNIVQELVKRGASLHIRDGHNRNPLEAAIANNHTKVSTYLCTCHCI